MEDERARRLGRDGIMPLLEDGPGYKKTYNWMSLELCIDGSLGVIDADH